MLRSRDYDERIRSMGFERATQWALSETIERLNMLKRDVKQLSEDMLTAAHLLDRLTDAGVMLRGKIEELDRRNLVDESHPTPSDDRMN